MKACLLFFALHGLGLIGMEIPIRNMSKQRMEMLAVKDNAMGI